MLQLVSILTQLKSTAEIDQETTYHLFFFGVERLCLAEVSFQLNFTGKEAAGSTTLPCG